MQTRHTRETREKSLNASLITGQVGFCVWTITFSDLILPGCLRCETGFMECITSIPTIKIKAGALNQFRSLLCFILKYPFLRQAQTISPPTLFVKIKQVF
jgi:hypothetical protein